MIFLALVPGIGSLASSWQPALPDFVTLVPMDYKLSDADMDIYAPEGHRFAPGRRPGEPGDAVEVAALRLLSRSLQLAGTGAPWAIAGHSCGGPVVYRCMDLLSDLFEDPHAAAHSISTSAEKWLSITDSVKLKSILASLHGKAPSQPRAVISFEGTLLPCDVDGWAKEMSDPNSASAHEAGNASERTKWCTQAADSLERSTEAPPRHLLSIRRWLQLSAGPPFVYFAGNLSGARNKFVFPALREVLEESGAPASRARMETIPGSGHDMNEDAPDEVRKQLALLLHSREVNRDHVGGTSPFVEQLSSMLPAASACVILAVVVAGVAAKCRAGARLGKQPESRDASLIS